jgi:hypothetical protein
VPSAYELATLVLGAFTALGGIVISLMLWIGREEKKRADETRADLAKLRMDDLKNFEVRLKLLEAGSDTVKRHDERLTGHDQTLARLAGDVHYIRERIDEAFPRRKTANG